MVPHNKLSRLTSRKWADFLYPIFQDNKEFIDSLKARLKHCKETGVEVYPDKELRLRAFKDCDLDNVKVVIIGQDPYPKKGDAQGVCFALPHGKMTPSMRVIITELCNEYFYSDEQKEKIMLSGNAGDISHWAKQGVLMLNTALTVEQGAASSHLPYWKDFTKDLVEKLSRRNPDIVWLLWGAHARSYVPIIQDFKAVLETPHPMNEIYRAGKGGFYGSDVFIKTNILLKELDKDDILWFNHFLI